MRALFPRLDLPPDAQRTFRFHLAYALLDAACGGVLLNAPFVALREIQGENWHLPLRDGCVGVGMLASLYLGSWMAPRCKMPFVFLPGILAGLSSIGMVLALGVGSAFWFLMFFGIGGMFEITTRPAIAAILRENYPVAERGRATATVRQWSSLSFMIAIVASAYVLQCAGEQAKIVAGVEILFAAAVGVAGFFCFRRIPLREHVPPAQSAFRLDVWKNVREVVDVMIRDARFRRYLLGCFMEGFFGMLYLPLIPALLRTTLQFDYVWCALFLHGIPTLAAFLLTGLLGRWFDQANPWVSWAWVRFAFGLDALLLAATPWAATWLPAIVFCFPVLGRLLRGGVQGGWWILWWQIGITHFAPPGDDTSRYAGIMTFLNGVIKIAASAAGMALTWMQVQPVTLLWIGGAGVIATGVYSLCQAARDRKEHRPETFSAFEAQFEK